MRSAIRECQPIHPGEMLLEEFLVPMHISSRDLADAINMPFYCIEELINRNLDMTPCIALRLADYFGVSSDFWLNLQIRWDRYMDKNEC